MKDKFSATTTADIGPGYYDAPKIGATRYDQSERELSSFKSGVKRLNYKAGPMFVLASHLQFSGPFYSVLSRSERHPLTWHEKSTPNPPGSTRNPPLLRP